MPAKTKPAEEKQTPALPPFEDALVADYGGDSERAAQAFSPYFIEALKMMSQDQINAIFTFFTMWRICVKSSKTGHKAMYAMFRDTLKFGGNTPPNKDSL